MRQLFTVAVMLANASAYAAADDHVVEEMLKRTSGVTAEEIRRGYDACDSGITWSMKLCASYRWTEQDIRLNAVYEQLRERVDKGYLPSLVKAQKAWLAYRDSECAVEGITSAGGGGAEEGLYALSCKEDLTRQQADRLASLAHE